MRKLLVDCYEKDPWLSGLLLSLLILGCVLACTSTPYISQKFYHVPWYYFARHMLHVVLAFGVFMLVLHIPSRVWYDYRWGFLLMGFLMLSAVFVPSIAPRINGARRWVQLPGFMIQTSDVAKFCWVVFLAGYFQPLASKKREGIARWLFPLSITGVAAVLLLLQPDMGACVVMCLMVMHIMFFIGMPFRVFGSIVAGLISVGLLLIWMAPYRLIRVLTFLNPWKYAYGAGYQLTQSLMAIGRGGLWGVGVGDGVQKIFYLPEAHTDFVFAVLCEEFGLLVGGTVVIIYALIFLRALRWSCYYYDKSSYFSSLYTLGIGVWMVAQASISIGVNIGLFPTKGLVLPLLSYGGSHMLVLAMALGVLFRMILEDAERPRQRLSAKRGVRR